MSSRRRAKPRPRPATTAGVPPRPAAPKALRAVTRSVVAAAKRVYVEKFKRAATGMTWQAEAWAMYDQVGELRFVTNSVAAALSLAELHPVQRDPVTGGWNRLDDPANPAVRAMNALWGDSPTGQSEKLRKWAQHLFVAGESWLVGHPEEPDEEDAVAPAEGEGITPFVADPPTLPDGRLDLERLVWDVYSSEEVKTSAGQLKINGREYDPDTCVVIRLWREHPRMTEEADSPVRSSLPVLRELIGLTMHVSATIDSRLAGAGLLVIPKSATILGAKAPEEGEDQDEPFIASLMEAMLTAIKDRDSAAAVVPIVVEVPDDVAANDLIKRITFDTPLDAAAKELRDEAIRRLALGLDAPPERLLGMGETNHWSAWQLAEDEAKLHVAPPLGIIRDALTREYLRVVLEDSGIADPENYAIEGDLSALTLRPDRTDDAFKMHALGLISDLVLVEATGFDPEDMPVEMTVEQKATKIALALVEAQPSLIVDPGLPKVRDQVLAVLAPELLDPARLDAATNPPKPEPAPVPEEDSTEGQAPDTQTDEPDEGDVAPAQAA